MADFKSQLQYFFIWWRVMKSYAALNDRVCVGELGYRMSAKGVDQNIDLTLKSFIVKPMCRRLPFISSVPPTHWSLELHMLWSVNIPCCSSPSRSIYSMCLSMFRRRFLSYILCSSGSWREETGSPFERNCPFFMALTLLDRDYGTTGMLVLGSQ